MSQEDLAEKLDITRQTLSKMGEQANLSLI